MTKREPRIIRITTVMDEQGRTIALPVTKADKRDVQSVLKNEKGLIIGKTLEDSKQCPLEADSDLPFDLGLCGIEA